jgi:hypothetical protein
MARFGWLAVLAVVLGCKSTAPYTVPAAAINTALAVGTSLQQRAEGGCFATCAYGTVCDPRTGTCVKETSACGSACQSWEVCVETEPSAWRCIPATSLVTTARQPSAAAPGEVAPGVGISPATGSVPLPPSSKTPDVPPTSR